MDADAPEKLDRTVQSSSVIVFYLHTYKSRILSYFSQVTPQKTKHQISINVDILSNFKLLEKGYIFIYYVVIIMVTRGSINSVTTGYFV